MMPEGSTGYARTVPLQGQDIICLGPVEWGVINSVTSHSALGLAKHNRVLYVEPLRSWATLRRTLRWQRRGKESKPALEHITDNLWVFRPPPIALPGLTRWRFVSEANGIVLARLLRRVSRQMGLRDPILWSTLYESGSVLRHFASPLRIFESVDYDAALARDDSHRALVLALEADACRSADLVMAVTEELAQPLRAYNTSVHVVNCAADLEFFGRALDPATPLPPAIARLSRPVIGYLGGVDPWKIDIALLRHIAQQHPEWSIALVGYIWFGFDASVFADCPNIHLLGKQRYEDFPGFLKGIDVAIMPFPLNDVTLRGDALKLYEYLAGGRPVVSTRVPAACRLADVVRIADAADDFARAIEAALAEPPALRAARLLAVRPHSWEARVREKSEIVRAALDARAIAQMSRS
ncbi:glycosyltransferase [Roseomonas sp. HJA6]|uniref:Glycosyltransferase n=1 Tax=Roseomonas alba TaxID=2846776 RepID=A0ABS7A2G5_9PROT|nr:glycosyltransferase [Neoroseomonas alba]MBW6396491.1 glycosyltransferase [Neoroseomonas alba]